VPWSVSDWALPLARVCPCSKTWPQPHPQWACCLLALSGALELRFSILAFGCGSRFLMYEQEDQALAALNHAIDLGISPI
jgi:hypothetical protein